MPTLATLQSVLNSIGLHYDVTFWLSLFALVFSRVTAAVMLTPFLGGQSVPGRVKVGVGVVLSVAMLPALSRDVSALPVSALMYLALLGKEVLIGAVIGFMAQLVFFGVQMAGTIADTQRGMNQITFLAPQLEGHTSALGSLQFQAALVIFFALQGHLLFIGALMRSFRQLPVLTIPQMSAGLPSLAEQVARTSADALLIGFQIAAPVILAIFLGEVAFASMSRAAARIRMTAESYTAKSLLGLAMVFLLTAAFLDRLQGAFVALLRNVDRFVEAVR